MQIKTDETIKTVEIWLDSRESQNADLLDDVRRMCATIRETGYEAAIFKSGRKNLEQSARDLLRANLLAGSKKEFTNPVL